MKTRILTSTLLAGLLVALSPLAAYSQSASTAEEPPGLPPPDLNDPGVDAAAGASVEAAVEPAAVSEADGVEASPEEISETPTATEIPITGKEKSLPVITVRTDPTTGDRVEETRENGKLVRLLVQPKNAPAYVLHDANGDGRVDAKDAEGPVQPVYWELFKWD